MARLQHTSLLVDALLSAQWMIPSHLLLSSHALLNHYASFRTRHSTTLLATIHVLFASSAAHEERVY